MQTGKTQRSALLGALRECAVERLSPFCPTEIRLRYYSLDKHHLGRPDKPRGLQPIDVDPAGKPP
ncbi:MAG TPA: hypothetical protein VLT13_11675, partial [Bacteroidota bacterium]|nr:hypothetical protein [Bacteroidota bacterium]